jgi:hypothetical protein
MTALVPARRKALTQGLREVFRAEAARIRRRGGMPTGVIVAWCVGVLSSLGLLTVLVSLSESASQVLVTAPIEVGAFLSALVLATSVVFLVGRDSSGHLLLALTLTPRRVRLHTSRAAAFASTGAVVCGSSAIVPAAAGIVVTGGTTAGPALLGVLLVTLAAAWMALLAFGIATLARRGGPAILIFIGLLVVLPLVLGSVGGALPPAMSAIVEGLLSANPTVLFLQATNASTIPTEGFVGILIGQLGLALWAASAATIGGYLFARRDA